MTRTAAASSLIIMRRLAAAILSITFTSHAANAAIIVAVAGPKAGPQAWRTAAIVDGARQAVDAINKRGGLSGKLIEIVGTDDGCSEEGAKLAATDFVRMGVALVLGHPCQRSAQAAAEIYRQSDTLFIATASYHAELTEGQNGGPIFRLSAREDRQAIEAAKLITSRHGLAAKIALIHDRSQQSQQKTSALRRELQQLGITPVIEVGIVSADQEYLKAASAVRAAKSEAIFYAGFPMETGLLARSLAKEKPIIPVYAGASAVAAEFAFTFEGEHLPVTGLWLRAGLPTMYATKASGPQIASTTNARGISELTAWAVDLWSGTYREAPADTIRELKNCRDPLSQGRLRLFENNGDSTWPSYELVTWDGAHWKSTIQD